MVSSRLAINPETLIERLQAAGDRREGLAQTEATTLYRLIHGYGDQLPGLNIDWAAGLAVIWEMKTQIYDLDLIVSWLRDRYDPEVIIHKGHAFGQSGGVVLHGVLDQPIWRVTEQGLHFAIEPLAAQNLGIFIDARPVRTWLQKHSEGRLVLNTFAYTGSLGVAARAGGARGCIQVDLQAAQLERARRNHEINNQPVDDRDLMKADCLRWLRRRKGRVDGIVLDPPPRLPGRRKGDPQAWTNLVRSAAVLLEPGGWLLGMLNRRGLPRAQWEARVLEAAQQVGVQLEPYWQATSGDDFWEDNPEARLRVTAFRHASRR